MSDSGDNEKKWAGFADYQEVASQLHKDINRAVKAYSHVDSRASQGVGITPQTAVKTRSAILGITKRLFFEVRKNRHVDGIDEIYERWAGVELDEDGAVIEDDDDDLGYVKMLERADFTNDMPPWLDQLVDDIIEVGWELGYIRAGVEKPADPDTDEQQVKEMFE